MKKKTLFIIIITLLVASCDETEPIIFNGDKTLIYFENSSGNVDVVINDTGSLDVVVSTTTLKETDINVNIELVEEQTTAAAENFEFESSATIPAGEYTGSFTITGIDNSVTSDSELIVFRITDANGFVVEDEIFEATIREVCPVPDSRYVESTWNVSSIVCAGDGNGNCDPDSSDIPYDYQVTMEAGETPSEFVLSDITGGLYVLGYGASDNPATVSENCLELTVDAQPDVVFGGDEFNGTGSITLDDEGNLIQFEITWSNNWGDAGTSTYTLAD